jgi:hypothetical protein
MDPTDMRPTPDPLHTTVPNTAFPTTNTDYAAINIFKNAQNKNISRKQQNALKVHRNVTDLSSDPKPDSEFLLFLIRTDKEKRNRKVF